MDAAQLQGEKIKRKQYRVDWTHLARFGKRETETKNHSKNATASNV
jgi:hypothetical protein